MPTTRSALLLALLTALPTSTAAPYTLPFALNTLSNPKMLLGDKELTLAPVSAAQGRAIARQGFVISPASGAAWRQFHQVYEATRYAEQPVFVTTDSALHVYHLIFDKLLRDLERESLAPSLKAMTGKLQSAAQVQARALSGTPLEPNAVQALAYLAVAHKLIDPQASIPAEVKGVVEAQLKLIEAHAGSGPSPIFTDPDFTDDYTQYIPRSHYTRSATLKNYFKSMMWLGRVNLRVQSESETRTAALLTRLLSQDPVALKLWTRLYDPTTLLIGASDDLNIRQYAAAMQATLGPDIRALGEAQKLTALQAALSKLPPPRINSVLTVAKPGEGVDVRERETLGFRLMGQRFTLDGAALQQLVYREVGTPAKPRTLPRGLDLLAVLGSAAARQELQKLGDFKFQNFETQLGKVSAQLSALGPADWQANVYSGWIYTLGALANPAARDARYPAFMRTPEWSRKELLTALGSWTELRHDTLLYAKQVMAEMGSGGEPPLYPLGYVEPNLAVWERLLALEAATRGVLKSQNVLSERTAQNLQSLRSMLTFLQSVSTRELSGSKLRRDEYDRIHFYGGWLEEMVIASTDPATEGEEGSPDFSEVPYAGVVADVATDGGRGLALTEGTGTIQELLALVPDGKGGTQLARGGVYSHYEFTVPTAGRLTDEAWRAQLKAGTLPPAHPWLAGIVVK